MAALSYRELIGSIRAWFGTSVTEAQSEKQSAIKEAQKDDTVKRTPDTCKMLLDHFRTYLNPYTIYSLTVPRNLATRPFEDVLQNRPFRMPHSTTPAMELALMRQQPSLPLVRVGEGGPGDMNHTWFFRVSHGNPEKHNRMFRQSDSLNDRDMTIQIFEHLSAFIDLHGEPGEMEPWGHKQV